MASVHYSKSLTCFVAVLLFIHKQTVSGSGSFQIHLNSLRNIKHEKSNGECCDGRRTIHHGQSVCSDECDTFFRVCLSKQNTQHDSSTGPCMYGEFTTVVLRRSSISFTNTSLSNNGFRNPISIHLSSLWKAAYSLVLEARDADNSSNSELIDRVIQRGRLLSNKEWELHAYNSSVVIISYKIRVICDADYYGNRCKKFCLARNDNSGHYTCDKNGNKACLFGWRGERCDTGDPPTFSDPDTLKRAFKAWPATHSVKLRCKAMGAAPLKYTWLKDGKILRGRRLDPYLNTSIWYLELKDLIPTDSGEYTCIVSNPYGSINHTYSVRVLAKPRTRPILRKDLPRNKSAQVGESVTMKCLVLVSATLPDLRWLKWDKSITFVSKIGDNSRDDAFLLIDPKYYSTIQRGESYESELKISKVTEEDFGLYTCYASNHIGAEYNSAFLSRYVRPTRALPSDRGPTAPRNLKYEYVTLSTVHITWDSPLRTNGQLTSFQIRYTYNKSFPESEWLEKSMSLSFLVTFLKGSTVSLEGIQENKIFYIKARLANENDYGPFCDMVEIQPPSVTSGRAPPNVSFSILSPKQVKLSWTWPKTLLGMLKSFTIVRTNNFDLREDGWKRLTVALSLEERFPSAVLNVDQDKTFYVKVRAEYDDNIPGKWSEVIEVSTSVRDNQPGPPTNVVALARSPSSILVTWSPPNGRYQIIGYTVHYNKPRGARYEEKQKTVDSDVYSNIVTNLQPFTNYSFYVRAYTKKIGLASKVITQRTKQDKPSRPPSDLMVTTSTPDSLEVKWQPPPTNYINGIITKYIITCTHIDAGQSPRKTIEVPGDILHKTINGLSKRANYSIRVCAVTTAGQGPFSASVIGRVRTQPTGGQVSVDKSKQRFPTSVLPSPTPVDMPAKRTVEPRKPKACKMHSINIGKDSTCIGQETALHGESILLKQKEESWEIDLDRLMVSDVVLGEGEFGIVNKGSYRGQDGRIYDVAVKQLKDGTSMADKNDLLSEVKVLKKAGRHPNIVSLVGVCTREEKILVLTELVQYGSLKNFLISKRIACVSGEESRYVNVRFGLNDRTLLKIAFQIALGMKFLEKKKCVHRDLSSRNVFIGENLVAKVGDFGLARDISDYGIYTKISCGRVPWRWLSLESLKAQVYTAKSDVWSYGIVLWEIATYGEEPYPNIETPMDLILWLSMGNRMSRPEHSSEKLYEMMCLCWKENPLMRPTFADITKQFPYYLQRYKNNYMNIPKEDDGSGSEVSLLNGVALRRTGNMTTTV